MNQILFQAKLWLYPGKAGWHFITVPENESAELSAMYPWPKRGFGSIPVEVTAGKTSWETSVFPEKKGRYLLPVKRAVREKEGLQVGDVMEVNMKVREG